MLAIASSACTAIGVNVDAGPAVFPGMVVAVRLGVIAGLVGLTVPRMVVAGPDGIVMGSGAVMAVTPVGLVEAAGGPEGGSASRSGAFGQDGSAMISGGTTKAAVPTATVTAVVLAQWRNCPRRIGLGGSPSKRRSKSP
ncbi:hypothetical protein ACIBEF_31325 [Micromonospora sp. NPDC050795]|uniref:hypothetical protein n=1 Tax=Micromonospora sp. NPDC050795 TaxID=3364282 RepID=UPI0037B6B424